MTAMTTMSMPPISMAAKVKSERESSPHHHYPIKYSIASLTSNDKVTIYRVVHLVQDNILLTLRKVLRFRLYRVSRLPAYLGWVDFDLGCPTFLFG